MRGARGVQAPTGGASPAHAVTDEAAMREPTGETVAALRETAAELRRVRELLEAAARRRSSGEGP
jgi:hypothetical protein